MALYVFSKSRVEVSIPFAEREEECIVYVIKVTIGEFWWTVKHRYKDFNVLHQQLVLNHGLRKDLLPAKKIIGNRDPEFIEKRRIDLDAYLKSVVQFLEKALPSEISIFLNFHDYEIYSVIRRFASKVYFDGEKQLLSGKPTILTPIELHAISKKIQLPRSPMEQVNREQDFGHVLDFASNITDLEIVGSQNFYRSSNIIPNNLPFDLSAFKNLKHLILNNVNVNSLLCARSLRSSLASLSVHSCGLKSIVDIVMCDNMHKNFESKSCSSYTWRELESLDLSENCIQEIDPSIALVPKLRRLNLSHNKLRTINNLAALSNLEKLNLSNNMIDELDDLHTKLGNVKCLNLAQNRLSKLNGLSKLYGLVLLDVRSNRITQLETIQSVASLPCLESLILTGNPVTTVLDFRTKVLTMFGTRAAEICLDNEKPMQKELDTVAILQALNVGKNHKS